MEKISLVCSIILLSILGFTLQAQAVEISGELVHEFNYSNGEKMNQFGQLEEIDQLTASSDLKLGVSGLYSEYRYQLELKLVGRDFAVELEKASLSTFVGPTYIELAKKDWSWGEGFSIAPTYPLQAKQSYLATEANLFYQGYDFDLGLALTEANDDLLATWFKFGSLLATSDYQFVFSYSAEDEELLNLGLDYSKDFLNDLVVHSGLNLAYDLEEDKWQEKYLFGVSYYRDKQLIIAEYYRDSDDYLMLSLRDNNSASDWAWNIDYTTNLADLGQRRGFSLSYLALDDFKSEFQLINYGGADGSDLAQKPENWEIKFKFITDIF